jgi:UDP-glucuronate 4-epimerase
MTVLVTGAAGFIGCDLALRLLRGGCHVVGVDNLNAYYDVALKEARLARLTQHPGFAFERMDLADRDAVARLFGMHRFDTVVHLAAQAGVRYSLENPHAYIDSNLVAFGNVLEQARRHAAGHFVFASSSSVYGDSRSLPFVERDRADHPASLYAATKRANELMAYSYAHLYRLPCTGLRFFTVYGPWMRPDMAVYRFAEGIVNARPISVFNRGQMERDFTYIDDAVEAVVRLLNSPPAPHQAAPYRVLNIGNHRPVGLMRVIELLEQHLGRRAELRFLPIQPGDVGATQADVTALREATGFAPSTSIEEGIARFVDWFLAWHASRKAGEATTQTAREENPCA